MRGVISIAFLLYAAAAWPAAAQQQPAPPKPYKPVAITVPQPSKDASLDAFRGQIGDAAKKRDRTALGKLVAAKGFFWEREDGDRADKRKAGVDNLATALGLNNPQNPGWDMLAGYAEDPTVSASPGHKGAFCAPADPGFDAKAFEALLGETQTDQVEWGFPLQDGIEVRANPLTSTPIDKLGLYFVRILPDSSPAATVASYVRIVTPSGKPGYVAADSIAPLGNDQLCYIKDGGAWKVIGYIGSGDSQ
jgi:hypothetical protein